MEQNSHYYCRPPLPLSTACGSLSFLVGGGGARIFEPCDVVGHCPQDECALVLKEAGEMRLDLRQCAHVRVVGQDFILHLAAASAFAPTITLRCSTRSMATQWGQLLPAWVCFARQVPLWQVLAIVGDNRSAVRSGPPLIETWAHKKSPLDEWDRVYLTAYRRHGPGAEQLLLEYRHVPTTILDDTEPSTALGALPFTQYCPARSKLTSGGTLLCIGPWTLQFETVILARAVHDALNKLTLESVPVPQVKLIAAVPVVQTPPLRSSVSRLQRLQYNRRSGVALIEKSKKVVVQKHQRSRSLGDDY
jgi:hypothetical protein